MELQTGGLRRSRLGRGEYLFCQAEQYRAESLSYLPIGRLLHDGARRFQRFLPDRKLQPIG